MTNLTLLRQSVTNPGFRATFPPLKIKDPATKDERAMESGDMEWLKEKAGIRRVVEKEAEKRRGETMKWEMPSPPSKEKVPPGTTGLKDKATPPPGSRDLEDKKKPPPGSS